MGLIFELNVKKNATNLNISGVLKYNELIC